MVVMAIKVTSLKVELIQDMTFTDLEEWTELNKKLKDYEAMCKENYNDPKV